jgi:RND family efflux transporter MFP subunit
VLDEELNRLPERLRLPLVLCYLEGKTNEEAARQLGCPPGTIFSRLARGRELLRHRLTCRGLVLSTAGLTILLSNNVASAAASALLISPTFKAALLFASARIAAGTASARVVELAEGVLRAMFMTKLKLVTALFLVIGVLLAGGVATRHALEAAPQSEANQDKVIKPDEQAKPAQKGNKGPVVVQVMTPLLGGLERKSEAFGTVHPHAKAEIFAPVSGVLKNLTVDIGDRVKRGDRLADIDARLLLLEFEQAGIAVKQAKNLVREAEARWATATAEVEVAKAVVLEKEAALDSAKALKANPFNVTPGMAAAGVKGAEASLANAKSDVRVKESKVAQAKAALDTAQEGVTAAELGMMKAKYASEQAQIAAPFDGVVTQRNHFPGEMVKAFDQGGQLPLLTIVRIDTVRLVALVSAWDAALTQPGQPVDLHFDLLPDERFTGYKVSRIGFALDENARSMRVEIDVPNPKGLLRPGMDGKATIHLAKGDPKAFRIPDTALVAHPTKSMMVYVVRDGKALLTPIKVGTQEGSEIEIRSGLKPTDQVVVEPKGLTGEAIPVEVKQQLQGK